MPTPIITLPIHTIEQARALAGLLRAYIDGQSPDTNEGQDWKPDPDLAGVAALYAHLDAGIADAGKPKARPTTQGQQVMVARKVEFDSAGRYCSWTPSMDPTIGLHGVVIEVSDKACGMFVQGDGLGWWYSPEALDLVAPATH